MREVALDGGFMPTPSHDALAALDPDRVQITGRQEQGSRRTRRRMRRYRTGAEGRISHLKCGYGLRRTRLKGDEGHQTWNGWATFTYRYRGESCVLRTTALTRSLELRARVLPGLARTGDCLITLLLSALSVRDLAWQGMGGRVTIAIADSPSAV